MMLGADEDIFNDTKGTPYLLSKPWPTLAIVYFSGPHTSSTFNFSLFVLKCIELSAKLMWKLVFILVSN